MKHYIEIKLLPDAEIGLGFLWSKVYQQIHLALVEYKESDGMVGIGLSFPNYGEDTFPLGNMIRLFGQERDELVALRIDQWLARLSDYLTITQIMAVPHGVESHATFSRKQFKSNIERLARRQAKRQGISLEAAMKNYEGMSEQRTQLPFVNLKSLSTDQTLKLFIQKENRAKSTTTRFNLYGLSGESTVPCF